MEGFREGERHWPACPYPADFRGHVQTQRVRLWVESEGEGPPLFTVHGGPGINHCDFHPHLGLLRDHYILVYYDQRGHYMSDEPEEGGYGPGADADDLEALRVKLGYERISVWATPTADLSRWSTA